LFQPILYDIPYGPDWKGEGKKVAEGLPQGRFNPSPIIGEGFLSGKEFTAFEGGWIPTCLSGFRRRIHFLFLEQNDG
jgi:hypothetical protein